MSLFFASPRLWSTPGVRLNSSAPKSAKSLRWELTRLEERSTPSIALVNLNANLSGSTNQPATMLDASVNGRYIIFATTATDVIPGQIDQPNTLDLFWRDTQTQETRLITAQWDNPLQAIGQLVSADISGDGLFVAFTSTANAGRLDNVTFKGNFAKDNGDSSPDVFVWSIDPSKGTTTVRLASLDKNGNAVGLSSSATHGAISDNGIYASYLSPLDAALIDTVTSGITDNGSSTLDLFRHTVGTKTTQTVSAFGKIAVGNVSDVSVIGDGRYMTADGRFFVFDTQADPGAIDATFTPDGSGKRNVFQRDMLSSKLRLVSGQNGSVTDAASINGYDSFNAVVARLNGNRIIFQATGGTGTGLISGYKTNNKNAAELYFSDVTDPTFGKTLLVTRSLADKTQGQNGLLDTDPANYGLTGVGDRIVYSSTATNLISVFDTNNANDIFVFEVASDKNSGVSLTADGKFTGNAGSFRPMISDDGRRVIFDSKATNLQAVLPDLNNAFDIFIRDLASGVTQVGSYAANGAATANGDSKNGFIGTGANAIYAFESNATTLIVTPPVDKQDNIYINQLPIGFTGLSTTLVTGSGSRSEATVYTFNIGSRLELIGRFNPLRTFTGELRVAVGDLNGDGIEDIITAAGPGGGPRVTVIDGFNGTVLRDFFAYEAGFRGGVYVAAADINRDGFVDIVVGADEGGGPRVRVFDGRTNVVLMDVFVYESSFRGGVRVGVGDFNGDGVPDIVTGAGFGGGPRVTIFDGTDLTGKTRIVDFFAFEEQLRNGVFVGVSNGDFNNDGLADLLVGAGPGGGPRVTAFNMAALLGNPLQRLRLYDFFPFEASDRSGVRVTAKQINGDSVADIVVGTGANSPLANKIRTYVGIQPAELGVLGNDLQIRTEPMFLQELLVNNDFSSLSGVWVG